MDFTTMLQDTRKLPHLFIHGSLIDLRAGYYAQWRTNLIYLTQFYLLNLQRFRALEPGSLSILTKRGMCVLVLKCEFPKTN